MDFSIPMALVDFIPVSLFLAMGILLMRDLYNKMSKGAFALFAAGVISVFFAGTFKATWKLLYAANVCDFEPLSKMFFPLQALGFLLAGIGCLAMMVHRQGEGVYALIAAPAATPPVYSGTMIFVSAMILGLGMMNAVLAIIAFRMKKWAAAVLFLLTLVLMLGMGYLSSRDFAEASMNWIAEGVNVAGWLCGLAGAWILHKGGLADFRLHKEKTSD